MTEYQLGDVFLVIGKIIGDPEDEGHLIEFDAIEYEGGTWLVPGWRKAKDGTHKVPARIVHLRSDKLADSEQLGVRYTIDGPIPKSVLSGLSPDDYNVIELPNIRVLTRMN